MAAIFFKLNSVGFPSHNIQFRDPSHGVTSQKSRLSNQKFVRESFFFGYCRVRNKPTRKERFKAVMLWAHHISSLFLFYVHTDFWKWKRNIDRYIMMYHVIRQWYSDKREWQSCKRSVKCEYFAERSEFIDFWKSKDKQIKSYLASYIYSKWFDLLEYVYLSTY